MSSDSGSPAGITREEQLRAYVQHLPNCPTRNNGQRWDPNYAYHDRRWWGAWIPDGSVKYDCTCGLSSLLAAGPSSAERNEMKTLRAGESGGASEATGSTAPPEQATRHTQSDQQAFAAEMMRDYGVLLGAYLAMETALAKRVLADMNASLADPDEWPAGQGWSDLVQTSHEILWQRARAEAGLPREASFKNDVLMKEGR